MAESDQPIYWISVETDDPVSESVLRKIRDTVEQTKNEKDIDAEFIVSTKLVEPMGRSELTDYLNQALDAVEGK